MPTKREAPSCTYYKILEKMESRKDEEVAELLVNYQFGTVLISDRTFNTLSDTSSEKIKIYKQLSRLLLKACEVKHSEYIIAVLYILSRLRYKYNSRTFVLTIENFKDCLKALITTQDYKTDNVKIKNCFKLLFCPTYKYTEVKSIFKGSTYTKFEQIFWKYYINRFGKDYYKDNLDICNFFHSVRKTAIYYKPNRLLSSVFRDSTFGHKLELKKDIIELLKEDVTESFKKFNLVYPKETYESDKLISLQQYYSLFKEDYIQELKIIRDIIQIIINGKVFELNSQLTEQINRYIKLRNLEQERDTDFLGYETRESMIFNILNSIDKSFFKYYYQFVSSKVPRKTYRGGNKKQRKQYKKSRKSTRKNIVSRKKKISRKKQRKSICSKRTKKSNYFRNKQ